MSEDLQRGGEAFDAAERARQQTEALAGTALDFEISARGLTYGKFLDRDGQECSISESSLASEPAIRLGVSKNERGEDVLDDMHLTQEQAAALLPALQKFVETGKLAQ